MRRWLEPLVRRLWSREGGVGSGLASLVLLPVELAYRGAVAARNRAYASGWVPEAEPDVPTLSVGNLLVGGTGKTPVAGWIARLLADAERGPAVVSRGYGDDELELHRRWNPDVPVFADPDRARAVERAADAGARCCVLDDGFQHRRLQRRMDLVLVPAEGPRRVRLLPRGPWREPLSALSRADRVAVTRRTADRSAAREWERHLRHRFPDLPVAHLRLEAGRWTTVSGTSAEAPSGPLLAVTGIARPDAFRELARRATGSDVELLAYPDHHAFTVADLAAIRRRASGRTVVTTEKDAVRLAEVDEDPGPVRVLTLRVVEEEGTPALRDALLKASLGNSGAGSRLPNEGGKRPGPEGAGPSPERFRS